MRTHISERVRYIALTSILSAMSVAILSLGAVLDVFDLTAAAFCAIIVWFVTIEFGTKKALPVFIVTSVLSVVLLAFVDLFAPLFYIVFAGWYPLVKYYIDRIRFRLIRLALKLAIAVTASFAVYFFSKLIMTTTGFEELSRGMLYVCLALAVMSFLVLDFLMRIMAFVWFPKLRRILRKSHLLP